MTSPDYGVRIAEDFIDYLKTGDEKIIEKYSVKELKVAVSRLSPYYDNNKLWYRTLERRIEELSHLENAKRMQGERVWEVWNERWLDKIIAFALGFIGALLLQML